MEEDAVVDIEKLKIVLVFTDKQYSRYTLFVPLFKFSKSFLGFENKFSRYLKLKYKPRKYLLPKIANSVTSLICCGIDRFVRLDDEFSIEKGLAKSLGFPQGFPSSDTMYRFFASFTGWNIRQLEKVNLELLLEQKQHWYPKTGSIFIDLDMNTKSVEGVKFEKAALGYNRKRPGRLSLQWSVAHVAKIALYSQLHPGTTSGKTILKKQIAHLDKLLEKLEVLEDRNRFVWRVDAGYFSYSNLEFLSQRRFVTRLPKNLKVVKPYLKTKDVEWKEYTGHSEYVDFGKVYFEQLGKKLRLVLIKVQGRKKIYLYPLVTNLFNWKAKSIVKAYRGRQIVENCFRDTNQAFYSNKLPSSTFHGNQAFLWFIVLAYNLFFFFRKFQPPDT